VPKGTYVLSFQPPGSERRQVAGKLAVRQYEEIAAEAKAEGKWKFAFLVLVASLIVASAAVAFWLAHNRVRPIGLPKSVPRRLQPSGRTLSADRKSPG